MVDDEKAILMDFVKSVRKKDAVSAKKLLAQAIEIKVNRKKTQILEEL
jgi:hypothetical protein